MKPIFASLLFSAAACSSSPLDPGSGDNAGTGTMTLQVDGSVVAHPRIGNAKVPSDFDTDFQVRVSLNNQPVTTGTVTITSSTVKLDLTYQQGGGQNGRWEGTTNGYDYVYQLDVISGADKLQQVRVDGPDIHSFTKPLAGASLDSTVANDTTWSRETAADEARLSVGDVDGVTIADTGKYSLPPGTLHADQGQARPNTLRLTRTNRITPAGATGTSEMTVAVENELDVVALPAP
jgi:hypothetical protein